MENREEQQGQVQKLGERLRNYKVQTTKGIKFIPKDYSGSWLVLFSHSGAFTPVCTSEYVEFARANSAFRKIDCQLLGVSGDQIYIQLKWLQWMKSNLGVRVPFPVISDPAGRLTRDLGMYHPAHSDALSRTVIIVDDNHVVRYIAHYPNEVGRNIEEIHRMVKALQTADRHKAGVPANWPESSLVGKSIVLNPPKDEKAVEERLKKRNCFDWWFCYKRV